MQENSGNKTCSIFLQNAETVGLVCPYEGSFLFLSGFSYSKLLFAFPSPIDSVNLSFSADNATKTAIPVTSLKVGDNVMLRIQGGARHTGIEIQEFILEK